MYAAPYNAHGVLVLDTVTEDVHVVSTHDVTESVEALTAAV